MMKTTYFESRRDEVSVLVTQQVNNEEPELKKDDMNIVKQIIDVRDVAEAPIEDSARDKNMILQDGYM